MPINKATALAIWNKTLSQTVYHRSLDSFLLRDNNNLDLMRLILAAMVIYGHGFALTPSENMGWDKIYEATGLYAGNIAIKGFFMISGLLVTTSLLHSQSPTKYTISRFFRIYPAYCVSILFVALIIGPLVTTVSLAEYFSDPKLTTFVDKVGTMNTWGGKEFESWELPVNFDYFELGGVFESNAYPRNVNAPLWSIPAEIFCYFILALVFLVGGLNRNIATALFVLVVWDSLIAQKAIFFWIPQGNDSVSILPFCFALGAIGAVWRDKLVIGFWPALGAILLSIQFGSAHFGELLKYGTVFIVILYIAGTPIANRLRLPADVSYGVYLYGWPVQQIYNQYLPDTSYWVAFPTSLLGALLLANLSAFLIERPSQRWGRALSKRLHKGLD